MSDFPNIYQRLLDIGRDAIAAQQGLVAYHALSGAVEDAFQAKAPDKLDEVERLANRHIQWLLTCLTSDEFASSSNYSAELELYNALMRLIASHRLAM